VPGHQLAEVEEDGRATREVTGELSAEARQALLPDGGVVVIAKEVLQGRDAAGGALAPGAYFARLEFAGRSEVRKVVFMRYGLIVVFACLLAQRLTAADFLTSEGRDSLNRAGVSLPFTAPRGATPAA
jgi:hypothetical protein